MSEIFTIFPFPHNWTSRNGDILYIEAAIQIKQYYENKIQINFSYKYRKKSILDHTNRFCIFLKNYCYRICLVIFYFKPKWYRRAEMVLKDCVSIIRNLPIYFTEIVNLITYIHLLIPFPSTWQNLGYAAVYVILLFVWQCLIHLLLFVYNPSICDTNTNVSLTADTSGTVANRWWARWFFFASFLLKRYQFDPCI